MHNFSLVHDDLPALDDDAERRGKPSVWAAYGEGKARARRRRAARGGVPARGSYPTADVARELAEATLGMIGGQYLDTMEPGTDLETVHRLKTGCLFYASVTLALCAAELPRDEQGPWRDFADELGMLFQVVDDILDGDGFVVEHGVDGGPARANDAAERAHALRSRSRRHLGAGRDRRRPRRANRVDSVVKKRLDVLLVERGLAESRAQAQALILAGLVPGHSKAGEQVDERVELAVERGPRFVSRGGEKLDHALDAFGVDPARARLPRRRRLDGRLHRCPPPARRAARDRARRRLRPAAPAPARRPARRPCSSA